MNEPTINLTGTASTEPELAFSTSGKAIAHLNVAVNPRTKNPAGEWVDGPAQWWRVTVFGSMAEAVAESIRQGDRVTVSGRVTQNVWTPSEGENAGREQRRFEVIAEEVGLSLRFRAAKSTRAARATAEDMDGAPF